MKATHRTLSPREQSEEMSFHTGKFAEPSEDEEEEMRLAQELVWSMDRFRPANAVLESKLSLRQLSPGGGASRRPKGGVESSPEPVVVEQVVEENEQIAPSSGENLPRSGESDDGSGADNSAAVTPTTATEPTASPPLNDAAEIEAEDPHEASIRGRPEVFIPYNHWTDDAISLQRIKDHQEIPTQVLRFHAAAQEKKSAFQVDNFCTAKYFDVRGFRHSTPLKRSDPPASMIFHTEEDVVCYMAGHHITLAGVYDRHHRKVFLKNEDAIMISCFCVSSDGKYVAVAERLSDAPRIVVYRSDAPSTVVLTLSFQYVAKSGVVSMGISTNNAVLTAYCGPLEPKLVVWQLEDVRVAASVDLTSHVQLNGPVVSILFNPWESSIFSTVTSNVTTLWSLSADLKQVTPTHIAVSDVVSKFGDLNHHIHAEFDVPPAEMAASLRGDSPDAVALTASVMLRDSGTNRDSSSAFHHLKPSEVFVSQCWFDDGSLAVLTADGCVVAVDSNELVSISRIFLPRSVLFPSIANEELKEGKSKVEGEAALSQQKFSFGTKKSVVTSSGPKVRSYFDHIVWVSRGVMVAGPCSNIILLDRTFDERSFQQIAIFNAYGGGPNVRIIGMSLSPAEENLVIVLSNNNVQVAALSEIDDVLAEYLESKKPKEVLLTTVESPVSCGKLAAQGVSFPTVETKGSNGGGGGDVNLLLTAEKMISNESKYLLKRKRQAALENGQEAPHASILDSNRRRFEELENDPLDITDGGEHVHFGLIIHGESFFVPLYHGSFHHDIVTGVSVAVQLPYIATSSADRSLAVYNFAEHQLVAHRTFDEEIFSCTIHPSGLYVVIALEFFAKCYVIFENHFYKVAEMDVRGCHEVVYSASGSRLAFAVGNRVLIWDAYQFRQQGSLVGHTVMIKSIGWSNHDSRITTSDLIGTICCWDTSTYLRDGLDASQNSLIIQTARYHASSELVVAVGCNKHAGKKVFEGEFTIVCCNPSNPNAVVLLRPGMVMPKAMSSRKLHTHVVAIAEASQTLFVGTPTGRILMYSWPLLRTSRPYDYIDAHTSEILFICLTKDESYLLSVATDNTMFIFQLDQTRNGKFVTPSCFNYKLFDDISFGLSSSIDAYSRDASALRLLAAEQRTISAESLAAATRREEKLLQKAREDRHREFETLKRRLEKLKSDKSKMDRQGIQEGNAVELSYNQAAESLETLYAKVQEEAQLRHQQLEFEKDEVAIRFENTVAKRLAQYQQEIQHMERTRQDREQSLQDEIRKLEQLEARKVVTTDAMLCQGIVDYENELREVERMHLQTIRKDDDLVLRAMLAASVGDREVDRLKKDIAVLQTQLDGRKNTIKDLNQALERRHKETQELKSAMVAKQEAINIAERKMQQMKQNLTVLENLRFVLTHQFESLEGEVEPKDETIAELEGEVVKIEEELNTADEERAKMQRRFNELAETIRVMEEKKSATQKQSLDADRKVLVVMSELSSVVAAFRDPLHFGVQLNSCLKKLRERFGSGRLGVEETQATNEADKLNKELQGLKGRIRLQTTMANQLPKHKQAVMADNNAKILEENSALIKEAKTLRISKRELQTQVSSLENSLRDVRASLHRLALNSKVLMLTDATANNSADLALPALSAIDSFVTPATPELPPRPHASSATPQTAPRMTSKAKPLLPPIQRQEKRSSSAESQTWGGSSRKKKPSSAERFKVDQQEQLQVMLAQLDSNTDKMVANKKDIHSLRHLAQELLRMEEARLLRVLAQTTATEAGVGDTTTAAVVEEPDWTVQGGSPARPMTPTKLTS